MIYRYSHPEFFADWDKIDLEKENGKIILYGAGRRGAVAAHCLKQRGIEFACFCDSDGKKQGRSLYDHKIISPEELEVKYKDAPIMITTQHYRYVYRQLKEKGFSHLYSCVFLFAEIDFDGFELFSQEYMSRNMNQYYYALLDKDKGANYLTQVQFPVTMRCTLRCKECNAYIPYVKHPEDFNADEMLQSFHTLLTAYDGVNNAMLYGGEPLLFKDLYKMVDEITPISKVEGITIITNGTLLPSERLMESLRKSDKVRVRISDYGSYSVKKNELVEMLKRNGVETEVTDFKYWNKNPEIKILNETEEQLRAKVANCCANANMFTIMKGKLFFCTFSSFHYLLKAVPDYGDNYVELLHSEVTGEKLREKIERIRSMGIDGLPKKACRFCEFNNFIDNLPVAEQTTELLEFEKVY